MMANCDERNVKNFMIGAAVGVTLGAAIAILVAPKAGKEVREDICNGFNCVKDKSKKLVQGAKKQSDEVIGKLTEVKSKVQSKFTEIKEKENSGKGITEIKLQEDQEDQQEEDQEDQRDQEDNDIYKLN
jgi:gas vesicle protein